MSNIFGGSLYFDNPEVSDKKRTAFLIIVVLALIILAFIINVDSSYLIGFVIIGVLLIECFDGGFFSYLKEKVGRSVGRFFTTNYTPVE